MALQGFRIQMKQACYRESVSQSSTRRGKREKGSARRRAGLNPEELGRNH